jgi:hypothetical protein
VNVLDDVVDQRAALIVNVGCVSRRQSQRPCGSNWFVQAWSSPP